MLSISSLEMLQHLLRQTCSLELLLQLLSLLLVFRSMETSWTTCSKRKVLVSSQWIMDSLPRMFSRSCVNLRLCLGYEVLDDAARPSAVSSR